MKPRVWLEPAEFLRIVERSGGKVIRASMQERLSWLRLPKWVFLGLLRTRYMTEGDDFYYYTYSADPLRLPESVEVIDALAFYFW